MSHILMKLMIIQSIAIGACCAYEQSWPKMMYWIGATILNIGVLLMK